MAMPKMTQKQRQELIDRIVQDISDNFKIYHDFAMDCVRETVKKWDDGKLLTWWGENDKDEQLPENICQDGSIAIQNPKG